MIWGLPVTTRHREIAKKLWTLGGRFQYSDCFPFTALYVERPEFYSKPDQPKYAAKEIAYHGDGELFLFLREATSFVQGLKGANLVERPRKRSDLINKYF